MVQKLIVALAMLAAISTNAATVDEVDFGAADDSADAAASRPLVNRTSPDNGIIDISCDEATLADVLRQFRKATNANIISPDSTNLQRRVSVDLKNVPWLEALQSILNSRGFRIEERSNIYYVEEFQNKSVTRSYILNHASAEELADLFNGYALKSTKVIDKNGNETDAITSMESKFSALGGKVNASAFPNANVLVLSGMQDDLDECEKIIKAIDRAATQVYIEARFMELTSEAKHELGMKWDSMKQVGISATGNTLKNTASADRSSSLSDIFKDIGDIATTYNGTYSGTLSATDFNLFLSAFEEVGGSQVFSNPKVIISNGKEAVIDMTTKFPNLKITSQRNTSSGTSYTDYTAQLEEIRGDKDKGLFAGSAFFSWGISLNVKPRISPEGLISVKIVPSISELDKDIFSNDGFYQVQGGSSGDEKKDEAAYGKYPIIRMKSITTDFTMQDGCTAVIGGLSRTEEEDIDNGIPGLRSLPWIGPRVFGWKSRAKVQKEIIICVTIGIANPANLKKDVGMPKNAVLGREYIEGRLKEPGDRPKAAENIQSFDKRPVHIIRKDPYPQERRTGENGLKNHREEVDLEAPAPKSAAKTSASSATSKTVKSGSTNSSAANKAVKSEAASSATSETSSKSSDAISRRNRRH